MGETCNGWHGDQSSVSIPVEGPATCNICGTPVSWICRELASSPFGVTISPQLTTDVLAKAIRAVTDPPPMPAPVRELVEWLEKSESVIFHPDFEDPMRDDLLSAIAAVRAHYGEKP